MRNVLNKINIVGATMVYQERDKCRWAIEWLINFCDEVVILLDNYDTETENIVLEYKRKYKGRINIAYSKKVADKERNKISGQIKKRFKGLQAEIREQVFDELKILNKVRPIDMLIFIDSDETFINSFPEHLETFWNSEYDFMMTGFVETFDSMNIIMMSAMAPHGRVYKFKPEITNIPWKGRTQYLPYYNEKRPWKLRHVVVHNCWLTEEDRERRFFSDNNSMKDLMKKELWILPKDVRLMTADEIADYQIGSHRRPSKYPSITMEEYINNKHKYLVPPWDGAYKI